MKQVAQVINKLRGVNFVTRWNFHPTIRKENVAEHSFWVAAIAAVIADSSRTHNLAFLGLMHDAEEAITGDLPALVKARVPSPAWETVVLAAERELLPAYAVGAHERVLLDKMEAARRDGDDGVVKLADLLAALLYAREERRMGNIYFDRIERELIHSFVKAAKKHADDWDSESADADVRAREADRAMELLAALEFDKNVGLERPEGMSHL